MLKGGYISFHDLTTDHWMQVTLFKTKPEVVDLGPLSTAGGQSIRADRPPDEGTVPLRGPAED